MTRAEEDVIKLKALDAAIYDKASEIIASGEEHVPLVAVISDTDGPMQLIDVSPAMALGEEGKEVVAALITSLMQRPGVDVLVFISEAWAAVLTEQKDRDLFAAGVMASHFPNRMECLVVSYSMKGGRRALAQHLIKRPAGAAPKLERGRLEIEGEDADGKQHTLGGRFYAERTQ